MKIAATMLAAALAAGCAPGPDRASLSADFRAPQGLKVGVLDVEDRFGGFDPEAVRSAFVRRLAEIGLEGSAVRASDQTPARAALAAREAGALSALQVSLHPSDRPIHPRAPEDAFGRVIGPTPPPGRWFWIRVRLVDRTGTVVYSAESELQEPGLRPRDLAVRMLRPLEE
jgi:hypothetical protein